MHVLLLGCGAQGSHALLGAASAARPPAASYQDPVQVCQHPFLLPPPAACSLSHLPCIESEMVSPRGWTRDRQDVRVLSMRYGFHMLFCREDLFKDMMSEREDVAAKRNKCLGAQQAFREALAALEALPQQLTALTGRSVSQALPPDAAAWSEPAPIPHSSSALPGEHFRLIRHACSSPLLITLVI